MDAKLKKDVDNLKKDIEKFQKDLADSLSGDEEMTEDKISNISKKLTSAINAFKGNAYEKIEEINDMVKEKGKEAIASSRDVVSNKPLTAIAISYAAGLLTAVLLRCNKK